MPTKIQPDAHDDDSFDFVARRHQGTFLLYDAQFQVTAQGDTLEEAFEALRQARNQQASRLTQLGLPRPQGRKGWLQGSALPSLARGIASGARMLVFALTIVLGFAIAVPLAINYSVGLVTAKTQFGLGPVIIGGLQAVSVSVNRMGEERRETIVTEIRAIRRGLAPIIEALTEPVEPVEPGQSGLPQSDSPSQGGG